MSDAGKDQIDGSQSGRQYPGWTRFILPICIIAGLAFLVSLGTWQMKRLAWKEALIATVEENLKLPPLSTNEMSTLLGEGGAIEYRPVTARGIFHHDKEQYFFTTHKGKPGWHVYTPLERSDGSIVFVNRGFVPVDLKDPAKRAAGQVGGEVEIIGLARMAPTEKPNSFVPNNDLAKNIYYWKSISQMMGQSGFKMEHPLVPFFVDANDSPNPGGLPLGGITLISFPNSHLQYALTWYGLALTLLVVGGLFMFNRHKSTG